MHRGSRIDAESGEGRLRYVVDATQTTGPDDARVLAPDQGRRLGTNRRLITLTTCSPHWGPSGRFIVFGHLVAVWARGGTGETSAYRIIA
ncbi:hypothetical protein BIV57_00830 [Mangrovactinospora gilvigrisea]|uniref:Sortase n=1 Tax=Mangrovactinospora gilvigrisea TaxID=1428644 RepID=A0A1J7CIF8_9ACTN|nr:hypothetical protein BIV57_00830 [Mangrovactinospora gilvigrisea]